LNAFHQSIKEAACKFKITILIKLSERQRAKARPLPRQKVEDDNTEFVADEFIAWKKQVVLG